MRVTIDVNEDKIYKAMENVEKRLCKEWFYDSQSDYEDWAGDIVCDALWDFITELNQVADINIETFSN